MHWWLDMNNTQGIMSMEPVVADDASSPLIAHNPHALRKRGLVTVDIQRHMSMKMHHHAFQVIAGDVLDGHRATTVKCSTRWCSLSSKRLRRRQATRQSKKEQA